MDILAVRADILVACALVAAFILGLTVHRLFTATREHRVIGQLKDQVARLELKGDAAHRATLSLAARHNQLIGEHHEAEWLIRSLKAKLEINDANTERLSAATRPQESAVNEEFWFAEINHAKGSLN